MQILCKTGFLPYCLLFLLHHSVKYEGVQRMCILYARGIIPEGLNSASLAVVSVGKGSSSVGIHFWFWKGSSAASPRDVLGSGESWGRSSMPGDDAPPREDGHGGDSPVQWPARPTYLAYRNAWRKAAAVGLPSVRAPAARTGQALTTCHGATRLPCHHFPPDV